jgi:hypothetical protein
VPFLSSARTFADGYGRVGSSRGFESSLFSKFHFVIQHSSLYGASLFLTGIIGEHQRTAEPSTTSTSTNVSERHNNLLAPSANDRLILAFIRFSNTAVQENAVQQRRRKTAHIGDTQRTPEPGNKHAESISEHLRTFPSVSRMRYHPSFCKRLKPG